MSRRTLDWWEGLDKTLLEPGEQPQARPECQATRPSMLIPDHVHSCDGTHDQQGHHCWVCGHWWSSAREALNA